MARKPFTLHNNFSKVKAKIQEKPTKVMATIGNAIVREVESTTGPKVFKQRYKFMTKRFGKGQTLGHWARKREKDLQLGWKASIPDIVDPIISGKDKDPIKEAVIDNKEMIVNLIATALDEIRKE